MTSINKIENKNHNIIIIGNKNTPECNPNEEKKELISSAQKYGGDYSIIKFPKSCQTTQDIDKLKNKIFNPIKKLETTATELTYFYHGPTLGGSYENSTFAEINQGAYLSSDTLAEMTSEFLILNKKCSKINLYGCFSGFNFIINERNKYNYAKNFKLSLKEIMKIKKIKNRNLTIIGVNGMSILISKLDFENMQYYLRPNIKSFIVSAFRDSPSGKFAHISLTGTKEAEDNYLNAKTPIETARVINTYWKKHNGLVEYKIVSNSQL